MLGAPRSAPDSALAHTLWIASLDRRAELDTDSALSLLRAARRADPNYFPPHFDYIDLMGRRGNLALVRREYAMAPPSHRPLARCLAAVASAPYGSMLLAIPALERMERDTGPSVCTDVYLAHLTHVGDTGVARRAVAYGARAVRAAPQLAETWNAYAFALLRSGRIAAADSITRLGISRVTHAMARLLLQTQDVERHREIGDSVGAQSRLRELAPIGRVTARPGMRMLYLSLGGRSAWPEMIRLARNAGARAVEYGLLDAEATSRLDIDGDPRAALPLRNQILALSKHLGPSKQAWAYVRRGRVYSRMGLRQQAEEDLLEAVRISQPINEPYILGEAYHNLAHTYEELGDWVRASPAVDRFFLAVRLLPEAASVVARRDAGIIRWKAGWHVASRRAFDAMVREIDERKRDSFWAGEYFERNGDLRRALAYYRRGLQESEVAQNLGGLTRVYEALGMPDSAEWAARRHDQLPGIWQDGLLLPRILARHGQLENAARDTRAWANRLLAARNLDGAVVAFLQRAELLLEGRRFREALVDAVRADSLATSRHQKENGIHARRLRGSAMLALGDSRAGLAILQDAAALATRHPTTEGMRSTHLALAGALASVGRVAEAMAAYDRSARAVEEVSHRLATDLDRARHREGQLAAFDGALRTLLRAPDESSRMESLVRWSQRRKAAALALAIGLRSSADVGDSKILSVTRIQSSLREDEALIDFITVDSLVAALVIRRDSVKLVRFQVSVDSVRRSADVLRRPFLDVRAGRIDIARAHYDLRIAANLYENLITPLEPGLSGITRLLLIPDGPLHSVPFDALVASSVPSGSSRAARYASARYLADRYEVAYLPSSQFIGHRSGRRLARITGKLLAIGYDAPGVKQELAIIESAWPGSARALFGAAATEGALQRAEKGFAVVHFATHATADDGDPLASHLRLASDDTDDGLMHLPEIAALRMSARLVVLSGCETLGGRLYEGEGFMGLARAFIGGGAESVVATQWPIGEASAGLMGVFYRRLAAGRGPATALREAKLELRRRPGFAHPFFWAGFVVVHGE